MQNMTAALARASADLFHWIANLGPYSPNEIAFALLLIASAIVGIIVAFSIIARRNRAIEFIDRSEVVTSPLRNRAEARLAMPPELEDAPMPAEPLVLVAEPVTSKPQPPMKPASIRAQLVLAPFGGSDNARDIANARAITQRLKAVLAALAPHIEVAQDDKALGEISTFGRYRLTGTVRHMGDRIRLQAEMTDAKTGNSVFRYRYQGLPSEQDVMLAEITSRVLKATAQPAPEHKSDAA